MLIGSMHQGLTLRYGRCCVLIGMIIMMMIYCVGCVLIGMIIMMMIYCVGCVLIGVDQHSCVYVMRTMNTRDPVTEVPPLYLVNMFEYLITSGFDFWDVLTAVKSGIYP